MADCWKNKFHPKRKQCPKQAEWQGPKEFGKFCAAWRACDLHRFPNDIPLPPAG